MSVVYERFGVTVHHGDCMEILAAMPDSSVHAVVTDPPYGLEFMGKEWDSFRPSSARFRTRVDGRTNPREGKSVTTTPEAYVAGHPFQQWCEQWARECLRVLKPGGHMLAFGGTRTWHRLACAVEDAGFELRDSIAWLYGTGFPKSMDVSKAIDKARDDRADIVRVTGWLAEQRDRSGLTNRDLDAAFDTNGMAGHWTSVKSQPAVPTWGQWQKLRELVGFGDDMDAEVWRLNGRKGTPGHERADRVVSAKEQRIYGEGRSVLHAGTPVLDEAELWDGWGTALKPAFEPVVVGRKPFSGTVAATVLDHGTGALNIDACRIPSGQDYRDKCASVVGLDSNRNGDAYGEWTGTREDSSHDGGRWPTNVALDEHSAAELDQQSGITRDGVAVQRNREGVKPASVYGTYGTTTEDQGYGGRGGASRFFPVFRWEAKAPTSERPRVGGVAHPTVKPLALMRWLVRLVTPPGGVVLDPFLGSGTTAQAARAEGFRCIGIERDPSYVELIRARLDARPQQQANEPADAPKVLDLLDLIDEGGVA